MLLGQSCDLRFFPIQFLILLFKVVERHYFSPVLDRRQGWCQVHRLRGRITRIMPLQCTPRVVESLSALSQTRYGVWAFMTRYMVCSQDAMLSSPLFRGTYTQRPRNINEVGLGCFGCGELGFANSNKGMGVRATTQKLKLFPCTCEARTAFSRRIGLCCK